MQSKLRILVSLFNKFNLILFSTLGYNYERLLKIIFYFLKLETHVKLPKPFVKNRMTVTQTQSVSIEKKLVNWKKKSKDRVQLNNSFVNPYPCFSMLNDIQLKIKKKRNSKV